jgi:hypothetical protein
MKRCIVFILVCFLLILNGCVTGARIKGGSSSHLSPTGAKTEMVQSDDPKSNSNVDSKSKITKEILIPAGSIIRLESPVSSYNLTNLDKTSIILSSNSLFRTVVEDETKSSLGAAQKNLFQETAAKLSSLKWVTWVGVVLFVFGIASLFWLPLKIIIASQTTSLALAAGGLLLIFLPVIIVGHEMLIFFLCFGGATAYFFIYRYSNASTKAKIYKDFIDKNLDGVDDRLQNLEKDKKVVDKSVKPV